MQVIHIFNSFAFKKVFLTFLFGLFLLFHTYLSYAEENEKVDMVSSENETSTNTNYEEQFENEILLWGDGSIETVSKRDQTALEAANTVYVITREDIEASGAVEIADVFAFVPGLQAFYRSAQEPELIVRGLPYQFSPRLLVLVDGVTVYTLNSSGVLWAALPLTVDAIESIEVIRGPSSVFYGANAYSGVVNFITRRPEHFKGAVARVFGGTKGLMGATSTVMLPAGKKAHFRFSGQYQKNNGFDIGDGPEKNDGIESGIAMVDGFVDINENTKLRLGAWYRRSKRGVPELRDVPSGVVTIDSMYALAQLDSQLKNHTLMFKTFFYFEDSRNEGAPGLNTINQHRYDIQLEDNIRYAKNNFLSLGVNYRYNGSKGLFIGSLDDRKLLHLFSIYANNEWSILDNLILTTGGRYEYDSFSKHNWSARANLSYLPHPMHSIRASIARAVRTPSFSEAELDLVYPSPDASITIFSRGNPNLNPEDMISVELGYLGYFWNSRLRLSGDFFYNNINNIIQRTLVPIDQTTIETNWANQGATELFGIEYGFKLKAFDWWDVFFDHAMIFQTETVTGESPLHNISAGHRFKLQQGFSAQVALKYLSDYKIYGLNSNNNPVPESFRLDIRVAQKFWKDRMEVALIGQSLLSNVPSADLQTSSRPDRRIYGMFNYFWDHPDKN